MPDFPGGLRGPLSRSRVYSLVQRALGAESARRAFVSDHLRPQAGERLLDLGCGPADIVAHLPAVDYVGVDSSETYIEAARRRHGARGEFHCGDVRDLLALQEQSEASFDAVLSIGVIHHLSDDEVRAMAQLAARVLKPDGRLVTLDPVSIPGQSPLTRWLLRRDRGLHVRTPAACEALVAQSFDHVVSAVRDDLIRVPYAHVILECTRPRARREAQADPPEVATRGPRPGRR